jgi:hypothetical protein
MTKRVVKSSLDSQFTVQVIQNKTVIFPLSSKRDPHQNATLKANAEYATSDKTGRITMLKMTRPQPVRRPATYISKRETPFTSHRTPSSPIQPGLEHTTHCTKLKGIGSNSIVVRGNAINELSYAPCPPRCPHQHWRRYLLFSSSPSPLIVNCYDFSRATATYQPTAHISDIDRNSTP